MAQSGGFHRRRNQLLFAALRAVGLRDHKRNRVSRRDDAVERGDGELGRTEENDALVGRGLRPRRLARPALITDSFPLAGLLQLLDFPLDQIALQSAQMIDEQNAVQVIDLVQKGPRQQIFAADFEAFRLSHCARAPTAFLARLTGSRKPGMLRQPSSPVCLPSFAITSGLIRTIRSGSCPSSAPGDVDHRQPFAESICGAARPMP